MAWFMGGLIQAYINLVALTIKTLRGMGYSILMSLIHYWSRKVPEIPIFCSKIWDKNHSKTNKQVITLGENLWHVTGKSKIGKDLLTKLLDKNR